jgi:hypothetical protein
MAARGKLVWQVLVEDPGCCSPVVNGCPQIPPPPDSEVGPVLESRTFEHYEHLYSITPTM